MSEEKENKTTQNEEKFRAKNFFEKIAYSITKIEKYPEMAAEGVGKAISYIVKLVAILALVLCVWMTYKTYNLVNQGIEYLENSFPDFSYKDGILQVDSQEQPIILENKEFGKVIIDTNTDSEEQINQYTNSIDEFNSGVVITKNRILLKNISVTGVMSYDYKETLESMKITEFTKQNVIDYTKSNQIITLYISVFLTLFIYSFMMYFITTLWYIVIISILGYIAALILKMKMRYAAVFNMATYAVTLSVVLNIIYLIINIFTNFVIEYFQVMYIAVASIYLIAAIMIIKSDLIKKQAELMKIVEAQEIVKKELEEEKQEKPKDKEKEEEKKIKIIKKIKRTKKMVKNQRG